MQIRVKVIPRSSKNEIVGPMSDGTLKIKLTAAPVDGKANEALKELLSKHFHCAKRTITITAGETHSKKSITIDL